VQLGERREIRLACEHLLRLDDVVEAGDQDADPERHPSIGASGELLESGERAALTRGGAGDDVDVAEIRPPRGDLEPTEHAATDGVIDRLGVGHTQPSACLIQGRGEAISVGPVPAGHDVDVERRPRRPVSDRCEPADDDMLHVMAVEQLEQLTSP
jgi:hypothetical protein